MQNSSSNAHCGSSGHRSPYDLFLTRFRDFTSIQKASFEIVGKMEDCIITAPTGSGKTEAALLPVIDRILRKKGKGIFAIYITPLRALNRDLVGRLEWLGSELGVDIAVRHGDTSQSERRAQSAKPPQILITTPESVQNLLLSSRLREALSNLDVVIVDELHELYYNKRGAQLSIALERVAEVAGDFQRIGISATIGNIDEASRFLFGSADYKKVESKTTKHLEFSVDMPMRPAKDDLEFRQAFGLDVQAYARIVRVAELISGSQATLVFSNTRQVVESLGSKLIQFGKMHGMAEIGIHHSSIDKNERVLIENRFKEGNLKAIIATSSLELGIDVGRIDQVVQYGSPRQAIRLIQRVGRGGHREGEKSVGHLIVHNPLDGIEAISIVSAVLEFKLEKQHVEVGALDVLANQISAMTLEYPRIEKGHIFNIVRRAYPYSGLKEDDFDRVIALLSDLHMVAVEGTMVSRQTRGRMYFINSISVIPDSTRFLVKEAVENRIISTLDEEFVSGHIEDGAVFITKGLPWRVVSIEEDVIFVEPSNDLNAAVPDWDGGDIPVSRDIAIRVMRSFREGLSEPRFVEAGTRKALEGFISSQNGFFGFEEGNVVIEEMENCAIAYMPLGKQANEYMARAMAIIASSLAGGKVNVKATPYALILDYSYVIRRPDTYQVFELLKGMDFRNVKFVSSSDLFRYKFIQVAKLFGVIDKSAKVTKSTVNKIISFYENSPIYDEVVRDLYKNYFDIDVAMGFVSRLRSGEVSVMVSKKSGSPFSKEILQTVFKYGEMLSAPERLSVIEKLVEKYDGKSVRIKCTYCGHVFSEKIKVGNERRILCTSCQSPLVVTYSDEYDRLVSKKLSGSRLSVNDNRMYKDMMKEASLVDAYGDRALVALSTYGIGIETAARLLKYVRGDYKMFFVDVIEAQKNFIRNRKFWKLD